MVKFGTLGACDEQLMINPSRSIMAPIFSNHCGALDDQILEGLRGATLPVIIPELTFSLGEEGG